MYTYDMYSLKPIYCNWASCTYVTVYLSILFQVHYSGCMSALWMAKRTKKLEAFYFFGLTQHSSLCAECTHTQQHTVLGLEQETKNDGRTTNAQSIYWSPCAAHCIGGSSSKTRALLKWGQRLLYVSMYHLSSKISSSMMRMMMRINLNQFENVYK